MSKIDEKLNKVYEFLKQYIDKNSFPPSVREISSVVGINSTSTVFYYLEKLEQQGRIIRTNNKNRAITLNEPSLSYVSAPLVGDVCAGDGILAVENIEDYYPLPSKLFNTDDLFLLQVKGDSMQGADIFDKDYIVVKKQNTANNNDIVVALVDEIATVKRYIYKNGKIILHPENPNYSDMVFDTIAPSIQGIVIGSIKKFK